MRPRDELGRPIQPLGKKRRDGEPEQQHQAEMEGNRQQVGLNRLLALRRGTVDHRMQVPKQAGEGHR